MTSAERLAQIRERLVLFARKGFEVVGEHTWEGHYAQDIPWLLDRMARMERVVEAVAEVIHMYRRGGVEIPTDLLKSRDALAALEEEKRR